MRQRVLRAATHSGYTVRNRSVRTKPGTSRGHPAPREGYPSAASMTNVHPGDPAPFDIPAPCWLSNLTLDSQHFSR
eukprot:2354743-Prymnesium_polylepis.1